MKRGRKAKPPELRELEGNREHRPIPQNTPKFSIPDAMPEPPIMLDAYAIEEWNRVAPELYAVGLLTAADSASLGAFCMTYSRWRQAEEALQRDAKVNDKLKHGGLILMTKSGNAIQNPLVGIANKARTDMLRAAAEFGLTPSSRANLQGAKRGDEDQTEKKFFE